MTARRRARLALALAAALASATVSGCGSGEATTQTKIDGDGLTIYVSVPLHGASSASGESVLDAARLALDSIHGRIGAYAITLKPINNANPKTDTWDPGLTETNARAALLDKTLIGYIGDFNSGASAISIPLLNVGDVPQISPTASAVGLTMGGPEASPGEPAKYYPSARRTFARVVPNDVVQASVQARLQRSSGCTKTYALDDGEVDGRDISDSFQVAAKNAGLDVVGATEYEPKATDYSALAAGVAQSGANCVLIAALPENHAALVTRQVAAALPNALIFGTAGLAESTFANPALGGIPVSLDPRVLITDPALDPSAYPAAGRRFYALYRHRYGIPQPDAIFGYEAMSLLLHAISRATDQGRVEAIRSKVVAAIFETRNRHSALGTYSINGHGDTSIDRYGVWRIDNGQLRFLKAIRG